MAQKYTTEQLEFIERFKSLTIKELAKCFNEKFGTNKSENTLLVLKIRKGWKNGRDSRFKAGNIPVNKGKTCPMQANESSFKHGNVPANKRPIGAERINYLGYIEIKTEEPSTWELKQRLVWERHNGPIPDNINIVFKDGDPLNCDIENLEALTKTENCYINMVIRVNNYPEPLRQTARTIAKLESKIQDKTK